MAPRARSPKVTEKVNNKHTRWMMDVPGRHNMHHHRRGRHNQSINRATRLHRCPACPDSAATSAASRLCLRSRCLSYATQAAAQGTAAAPAAAAAVAVAAVLECCAASAASAAFAPCSSSFAAFLVSKAYEDGYTNTSRHATHRRPSSE